MFSTEQRKKWIIEDAVDNSKIPLFSENKTQNATVYFIWKKTILESHQMAMELNGGILINFVGNVFNFYFLIDISLMTSIRWHLEEWIPKIYKCNHGLGGLFYNYVFKYKYFRERKKIHFYPRNIVENPPLNNDDHILFFSKNVELSKSFSIKLKYNLFNYFLFVLFSELKPILI